MQDEYGRIWCGGVDFLQCGHPAFGELKLAPAAYDANPLSRRSASRLLLQHPQSVCQRRHSVPAEFHVVVQAAGNDATAFEVNFLCVRPALILLSVVHANDAAIFNGKVRCCGMLRVERCDSSVVKDQIGRGFRIHIDVFLSLGCNQPCRACEINGITTHVRRLTTQALKTALATTKGQDRITGPRVRFKTIATGKTPRKVATAIFHFGNGRSAAPGSVNQLSNPQSSSVRPAPSVNSTAS